jgi:hypothetical protein
MQDDYKDTSPFIYAAKIDITDVWKPKVIAWKIVHEIAIS